MADARTPVFDSPMINFVHSHLSHLQDAQSIPSLSTPSDDTYVPETVGEEDAILDGGTEDSSRSVEDTACAPEPNTHYNSDGGINEERLVEGQAHRKER